MSIPNTDSFEQQRLAAIDAATTVFAERGFHDSSLADVAECMGIAEVDLDACFESKGEALYEVCLFAMQDYVERMNSIAASNQSFEAKLVATVSSHVGKYRDKGAALRVYRAERLSLAEHERESLARLGGSYWQHLVEIFEEGIESGAIRRSIDCRFAAQAVIGMCDSWGELLIRNPAMDLVEVIENCIDLLINGFMDKVGSDKISIDV
jgi:AcrR family transcriptional regulator